MRIGVHIIPYNHLMRRARKEKDLTQKGLGELTGLHQNTISCIERMTVKISEARAFDIATILGYEPDDLFPIECRDKGIGSIDFVVEVDSLEHIETSDVKMLALPDPSESIEEQEIVEAIRQVLMILPAREQQILEMRFGIGGGKAMTLEEVGATFGVTRERIRSVEARALCRLRHPSKTRHLQEFVRE